MNVTQAYKLLNDTTKEILGETVIVAEDLSNIVDVGKAIFSATDTENFTRRIADKVGKMVFVNRAYSGRVPSLLMDSWEYGSILAKVSGDLPEAVENESWELVDGASYDVNLFTAISVTEKLFNKKVTFELDVSTAERQAKSAFISATAFNAFISMIYGLVEKSMTLKVDALIMRAINNAAAVTIHSGNAARAVNLLYLYNTEMGTTLTADKCLKDTGFQKFAAYYIGVYMDRLSVMSTLFNEEGKARFTPRDMLKIVMLSDFEKGSRAYLQADTYHKELASLPTANVETVPYWQGTGTGYAFGDISKIKVKTTEGDTVEQGGVLCVMFDRDAIGVLQPEKRVTSNWNAKGEFLNSYYKWDSNYFNDFAENIVVFYAA